jgi:hypothetical protein
MTLSNEGKVEPARPCNGHARPCASEGPYDSAGGLPAARSFGSPSTTWRVQAVEWVAAVSLVALVVVLRLAILAGFGWALLLIGALVMLLPFVPALVLRRVRRAPQEEFDRGPPEACGREVRPRSTRRSPP